LIDLVVYPCHPCFPAANDFLIAMKYAALHPTRTLPLAALILGIAFVAASCQLAAEDEIAEPPITSTDRDHWAYRPIVRPDLPDVNDHTWPRGPLDGFILAPLEASQIAPAREANRPALLRRLSFDLIGVPPTREELAAFEQDAAPDAYERQVDRLLAAPGYGDRWGQHWLDLARFAETDGYEHDKTRPEAWKYRDWVIASLNTDLPYDQFVTLQLAADEMNEPATPTKFCVAGPDMPDVNDQVERRHHLLNELTATAGSVLLGLQLGCAQCHDHKYDPLSQADFYRLRAIFEPAIPLLKRDVPVAVLKTQPDRAESRFWIRGDHRRPGAVVPPGFPRVIQHAEGLDATATMPGAAHPRQDFARWLFENRNPLPARVIANRIWQHHFGRGIFATPSDVGVMGASPTHPELLDYLAIELRERDWSLKRLHRTIVTSATYRQESKAAAKQESLDSLYGRFPRRRLEGEALRDAMLAVAGLLSSERGGPGVMPPLPEELVGTLLKGQWTTSKREADHYRRSIYLFARRNLRYPLFEAFDRPDANASCPLRNRSTIAPQSLVLFNSEFSLLAARRLAGRILAETDDRASQIDLLYQQTLSRSPRPGELTTLTIFLEEQQARIARERRPRDQLALPPDLPHEADSAAAAALVDACLALLNTSEFLYVD
jgi:hypothetical protein